MDWLADPQGWIAFITLLGLEIVLGLIMSFSFQF